MTGETRSHGALRALVSAACLLVALLAPAAGDEEVLLSLPRDFDVTAWPGSHVEGVTHDPLVLRFRGERVAGSSGGRMRRGDYFLNVTFEFEGTLHAGHLEGRLVHRTVQPYSATRDTWVASGTATSDGRLTIRFRLDSHQHRAMHAQQGWIDVTSKVESRAGCEMPDLTIQLPVGELQSSQDLSLPAPAPWGGRPPDDTGRRREGTTASSPAQSADARQEVPSASSGGAEGKSGGVARGLPSGVPSGEADDARSSSPWTVPVSPGAAAGAAAAVALTSLLGALWMFGASGLSPGDLLGSAPAVDELDSFEAPVPPVEPPVVSHRDGEVNPDTGEVWSESVGGWVGANYHEIERRHQAEVRRAQAVSDRESRQESARIAEELRASRARQAASERREAEVAAHAEQWTESVTIEPHQPGWTDYATKALEWAEWGTDTSVSVLGSLTGPAGARGAEIYTVVKETVKGVSEGVADYSRGKGGHAAEEGSAWVIVERAVIGGSKGVAKVGLDRGTGKLMDRFLDRVVSPGASALTEMATTPVREVTRQLMSETGREVRRSTGVALGRALVGSEMQAPVKDAVKGLSGESL